MRAFAAFFGLILLGLAGIAALSYPAWLLLSPHFDFPFHRIASRIGMLIVLIGFVLVARRMRLSDRVSLGYGLPWPAFLRETLLSVALGVATMLPVVGAMLLLQLRVLRPDVNLKLVTLAHIALQGIVSGVAVSLIEETFLRGAMHTGIRREAGAVTTILLTSVVFATLHFIGRYHIDAANVGPNSGLDMLAGTFAQLRDPLAILDAFLCLFGVGVVLGMVRELTGNIAACIGLHAGWVWVITLVREASQANDGQPLLWLLSRFDGVVGWLVLAWTVVMGLWLHRHYQGRAQLGGVRISDAS
jgi:membrane protease YdiL (CAAX protease family)